MNTSPNPTGPNSLIEAYAGIAYYKSVAEHPFLPLPSNEYGAYVKLVEAMIDLEMRGIASASDIQKLQDVASRVAHKLERAERARRRAECAPHPTLADPLGDDE